MLAIFPFTGAPGIPELIIFGVIILLLFGKRLPGAMRSLGSSVTAFRQGTKEGEAEADKPALKDDDPPPSGDA